MEIFFSSNEDWRDEEIILRDEEANHLSRVVRKNVGDSISITDGRGRLAEARIVRITKKEAHCAILAIQNNVNETSCDVTLAIALLKNPGRFDFCIEKATELGVKHIIPFCSERTVAKGEHLERWNHIARSAMKQSCRCIQPEISPVESFTAVLKKTESYDLVLCAHEKANSSETIAVAMSAVAGISSLMLCIGAEGGFTDEELEMARRAGCRIVWLGPRRLRSETAAIVALSQLGELLFS
jgi:16S rRNA (uracil1498-N3)-methyltransferase